MKALKVVQRMLNGALVSTFERCRDHIIKEKQMKNTALKMVQRMSFFITFRSRRLIQVIRSHLPGSLAQGLGETFRRCTQIY